MISKDQLAKVLLEGSLDCVFVLSYVRDEQNEIVDFKIVEVNPNVAKLTKIDKESLVGKNICEVFPFIKEKPFFKRYVESTRFKRPLEREFPIEELGARVTWMKHQFVPLENDAILAWRDISIQKDVELELRVRSEALENLSANAPGVLFNFTLKTDDSSQIAFFGSNANNPLDSQIHSNWIVEHALTHLTQEKSSSLFQTILHSAKTMSPCHWVGTYTTENKEEHWIQCKSIPRKQDNGDIKWYGIAIDFTDQFKTARELDNQKARSAASAKMAALGEMASSVAHEVNTPLTVIKLRTEQALAAVKEGKLDQKKLTENLEKMSTMTDRVAKIIKSLRHFAREGSADDKVISSLQTIISETLDLCQSRFANSEIPLKIPQIDGELRIDCRSVQISQVILNILSNSFDAVQSLEEKWVEMDVVENATAITISITDSGKGIPEPIAQKLMTPFFTTKEVGKGTGLGLSLSKGIIEEHGGKIYLDTHCPNTRFVIELPKKQSHKVAS